MNDPSIYLNTDLDLSAEFDLQPLANSLENKGLMVLTVHAVEDAYFAAFEAGEAFGTLESNVTEMLDAIEGLDDDAKVQWAACSSREFNIGYERSDEPVTFEHGLSQTSIARLAAAQASLRITLYPPAGSRRIS